MTEVYVSSAIVKFDRIEDSVTNLAENGFKNIELSGGTNYTPHSEVIESLLRIKNKYGLNYLLHNYFPAPKVPFILNLATNQEDILKATENHLLNCLDYSVKLGAKKFGFHAGFFFNIPLNEIGKKITAEVYSNFLLAQQNFIERYKPLKNKADKLGIELYLENNVYSATNNERYGSPAPAMLLNNLDYAELKNQIDFNLLLDVAHLKVSCKTLNKNFESELEALFSVSDYIHISDNDGLHDTNNALVENSELHNQLKGLNWQNKTVTLEIYESLDKVKDSLELTKKMINA